MNRTNAGQNRTNGLLKCVKNGSKPMFLSDKVPDKTGQDVICGPGQTNSLSRELSVCPLSVRLSGKRDFSFEAQIFLRRLSEIPLGVFEVIAGAWR